MYVGFCQDASWRRSTDFSLSSVASHLQKKRMSVGSRIDSDGVDTGKSQFCIQVHSRFMAGTYKMDFCDSEHTDSGNTGMYGGSDIWHDCKVIMETSKDLGDMRK